MRCNRWRFSKSTIAVGIFGLAVGLLAGLTALISGNPGMGLGMGVVDDWTHHHLVFSNPGTAPEALAQGRVEEWYRIVNDPRYNMQQMKRNPMQRAMGPAPDFATLAARMRAPIWPPGPFPRPPLPTPPPRQTLKRDWSMDLGPSAKVGAGMYPAKYSFSTTTASCTDFVVYNTGLAGSNTGTKQANVIAYDNIYSGCGGTVPTVYWAYYTGTGAAVTSTVLSLDGSKVAFIENPSSGAATLRILKWVSGQGTDFNGPVAPTNLYTNTYAGATSPANTAWTTCPSGQSCMISVAFQTQLNRDSISSPWYDYNSDKLWVGDSGGYLHEFTGVFNGTPGEMTNHNPGTCGVSCVWPVNSGTGPLSSPVYDPTHALVFLGNHDRKLASVSSSTGALVQSSKVGYATPDISEAPLVDPAAGEVYVFVGCGPSGSGYCLGTSAVLQFPYNFAASANPAAQQSMGPDSDGSRPLYAGAFDNAYFTSTAGSPTGHMWVCGDTSANDPPRLYYITISGANGMNGSGSGPQITNATATTCSPVTEFCSTTTGVACSAGADTSTSTTPHQNDYIFVSPQTQSTTPVGGCTASIGCVLSYTIKTDPAANYSGAGGFPGGASGMIVDTQSTSYTGTLQVYFGILGSQSCGTNGSPGYGTGGCAIQASQAAP